MVVRRMTCNGSIEGVLPGDRLKVDGNTISSLRQPMCNHALETQLMKTRSTELLGIEHPIIQGGMPRSTRSLLRDQVPGQDVLQ